jgi:hypothetical protein
MTAHILNVRFSGGTEGLFGHVYAGQGLAIRPSEPCETRHKKPGTQYRVEIFCADGTTSAPKTTGPEGPSTTHRRLSRWGAPERPRRAVRHRTFQRQNHPPRRRSPQVPHAPVNAAGSEVGLAASRSPGSARQGAASTCFATRLPDRGRSIRRTPPHDAGGDSPRSGAVRAVSDSCRIRSIRICAIWSGSICSRWSPVTRTRYCFLGMQHSSHLGRVKGSVGPDPTGHRWPHSGSTWHVGIGAPLAADVVPVVKGSVLPSSSKIGDCGGFR